MSITAQQLRDLLSYDREAGVFTWLYRPRELFKTAQAFSSWNTRYAGTVAGNQQHSGYVFIRVYGSRFAAHRLAWLYMTGKWPDEMVDHVDGIRDNNRWANLRAATHRQNSRNSGAHCNNTSGFKGVYLYKDKRRWQASIRVNTGRKWLGIFDTPEEAHAAYAAASSAYHGEFGRAQ